MAGYTYDEAMSAANYARSIGRNADADRIEREAERYLQTTKQAPEDRGFLPHMVGAVTGGLGAIPDMVNQAGLGLLGMTTDATNMLLPGNPLPSGGDIAGWYGRNAAPGSALLDAGAEAIGIPTTQGQSTNIFEALGSGLGTGATLIAPTGAAGKGMTTAAEALAAKAAATAAKRAAPELQAAQKAASAADSTIVTAERASALAARTEARAVAAPSAAAEAAAAKAARLAEKAAAKIAPAEARAAEAAAAAKAALTAAAPRVGKLAPAGRFLGGALESTLTVPGAAGMIGGTGAATMHSEAAKQAGMGPGVQALAGLAAGIGAPMLGTAMKAGITKALPQALKGITGATDAAAATGSKNVLLSNLAEGRGAQLADDIANYKPVLPLTAAERSGDAALLSAERDLVAKHPAASAEQAARLGGLSLRAKEAMPGSPLDVVPGKSIFRNIAESDAANAAKQGTSVLDAVAPKAPVAATSSATVANLNAAKAASRKAQSDMWEALPKYQAPIGSTRDVLENIARERGRLSVDWPENVRKLADALGNKKIVAVDIKPLNNMYSDLQRAIRAERGAAKPNNELLSQYGKLATAITNDLNSIPNSGVGAQIQAARAATATHYGRFGNEGAVDKMLRNSQGGNKNPVADALENALPAGRKFADRARQLLEADPKSAAAIETVLRDRFIRTATSGSKTFKAEQAENWLRAHDRVLAMPQFQKLGADLRTAVRDATLSGASKTSHAATFATKPKKAVTDILTSDNPAKEMSDLLAKIGTRPAAEQEKAMKALKGAFVDHLVNSTGKSKISGTRLQNMLNDPQVSAAGRTLFSPEDFATMQQIASDLGRAQMSTRDVAHLLTVEVPGWKTNAAKLLGLRTKIPGIPNGLYEQSMKSNIARKLLAPDPTPKLQENLRSMFQQPEELIGALRLAGPPAPPVGNLGAGLGVGDFSGLLPKSQKEVIDMTNPLLTAIMGSGIVAANDLRRGMK